MLQLGGVVDLSPESFDAKSGHEVGGKQFDHHLTMQLFLDRHEHP